MSNLTDIGFSSANEQDINDMITNVLGKSEEIRCPRGFYLRFTDPSGAQIYLQGNFDQELVGFNPHFEGKSRRRVGLIKPLERDSSPLDGGFHASADPQSDDIESSGEYPFVFDVPDFFTSRVDEFPEVREIQLTAFASNDLRIFADESEYYDSQTDEPKVAAKSFAPTGMFLPDENATPIEPPRPIGLFSGEIKEFELKTNELTGREFYWLLVETLGGETDVVADPKLISIEPQIGGIVRGQFWLSGRVLDQERD